MHKTSIFKFIAVILAFSLMVGCAAPAAESRSPEGNEETKAAEGNTAVTTGELADYFIKAADDYHPNVKRSDVLEGFSESEQATRLQMFLLSGRAF